MGRTLSQMSCDDIDDTDIREAMILCRYHAGYRRIPFGTIRGWLQGCAHAAGRWPPAGLRKTRHISTQTGGNIKIGFVPSAATLDRPKAEPFA
jgi:hypothetical protein